MFTFSNAASASLTDLTSDIKSQLINKQNLIAEQLQMCLHFLLNEHNHQSNCGAEMCSLSTAMLMTNYAVPTECCKSERLSIIRSDHGKKFFFYCIKIILYVFLIFVIKINVDVE